MARVRKPRRTPPPTFAIAAAGAVALAAPLVAALLPGSQALAVAPQDSATSQQEAQLGLPDAPRNLQVLPAEMSTRAVVGVMRGMTGALGTRCSHCHLDEEGGGMSTTDFASDAKETKRVARVMMQMVQTLNDDTLQPGLAEVGRADAMEVTCQTCHRGNTRPVQLQDVLAERHASDGVEGALALFDELYARHYGAAVYDFSDGSLIRSANEISAGGDLEAGQALIDRALELYPDSVRIHFSWGQALQRAGENDRAKASFQRCLEVDPEAGFCQRAIDAIDNPEQQ